MPKTIRNKYLTYEKLMEAHIKSRKGKGLRKEIILFNLKQEEYILWLLEELKNKTYKHGGYTSFYVTEPKVRKIKDKNILWLVHEILYAQKREKGLEIGYRNFFVMESCMIKYLQFKAFRIFLLSIIFYFLLLLSFKESFNQFNKSFFSFDEYRTIFESSSECVSIAFLFVSGLALAYISVVVTLS